MLLLLLKIFKEIKCDASLPVAAALEEIIEVEILETQKA